MSTFANTDALYVNKNVVSYAQLQSMSNFVSNLLDERLEQDESRVAILSQRELLAYVAIVACILTDKTYVPLNTKAPLERLVSMLVTANVKTIIVSEQYKELAEEIKTRLPYICLLVIDEETLHNSPLKKTNNQNNLSLQANSLAYDCDKSPQEISNGISYIMFTSGSTGKPKGVPIFESNLLTYFDFVIPYCGLSTADRASQTFDLTFDLSVHDLFVTWLSGACLYVLPNSALFSPAAFIKEHELTAWFSVPSTGAIMQKFGLLKEGAYPSLKLSLFCGEALSTNMAKAWQKSAPNSKLINFYGPTEATIACAYFEVPWNFHNENVIPIGKPFPHMNFTTIANEELLITGPQVTTGYLDATETMNANFESVVNNGNSTTCYHSGDKVTQLESGDFVYHGRLDEQVKIQGYRVELSEIEAVVKELLHNNLVKVVVWPNDISSFNKAVYLFIQGDKEAEVEQRLVNHLKRNLPHYMQPKKINWIESMPLNLNGKIDRNALRAMLG